MKITELLGLRAMTFMDWFGWLHGTEEGRKLINRYQERYRGISEEKAALMMIHAARAVLGGQMDVDVVVRPEDPNADELDVQDYWARLNETQNWKPLFLGEWLTLGHKIYFKPKRVFLPGKNKSIDDFIREASNNNIELLYNPEYLIKT